MFLKIFCGVLVYTPWHRPLLAQPGPWREAIHCALLSSFICASILIATCLLLAVSLAAGLIKPTLAKVHIACALTAHVETRRRYWPTMIPRRCSASCLPVDRQMWATLASAQVWTSAWRSSEPSAQLPDQGDWLQVFRGTLLIWWHRWRDGDADSDHDCDDDNDD